MNVCRKLGEISSQHGNNHQNEKNQGALVNRLLDFFGEYRKFPGNEKSGYDRNSQQDKYGLKHLIIVYFQWTDKTCSTVCIIKMNVHVPPKSEIKRGEKDSRQG